MSISTTIAIRKTMEELVQDRDAAVSLVRTGCKAIGQADDKLKSNGSYGLGVGYNLSESGLIHKIDSEFWRLSFKRTGMTQIMDARATRELQQSLEKNPPAFNMANIESQYLTMYQDADMMFRRGIYEVFSRLDWNYRTNANEPYQLSAKNIVCYMFDTWTAERGRISLNYDKSAMVNDIDRCMKVLSGRKHHPHELETKINSAMQERPWIYDDDDIQLKGFKNGNGHLLIKDPKMVEKLNLEIEKYCNHMKLAHAA